MEQKGLTKKQFRIQLISPIINLALGVLWLTMGVEDDGVGLFSIIIGSLFIVISIFLICSLIVQRRRHPIEDASVDKEVTEGLKAGGLALLLIAVGFLLAIGLVFLFR